jgi:hypothetical protein
VGSIGGSGAGGPASGRLHVSAVGLETGAAIPKARNTDDFADGISLTAVTGVQAAGSHDYAVDCNQTPLGAISYFDVGISAVAISPD